MLMSATPMIEDRAYHIWDKVRFSVVISFVLCRTSIRNLREQAAIALLGELKSFCRMNQSSARSNQTRSNK